MVLGCGHLALGNEIRRQSTPVPLQHCLSLLVHVWQRMQGSRLNKIKKLDAIKRVTKAPLLFYLRLEILVNKLI